ncbi:putative Ig domain-containing protein [Burkholderiaceae bacterium]|nr:putative Ig domain-containing protein [Burkholderiaceae bacterium]
MSYQDVKYLCVLIDDFTYRSSNLDNVTIFDFGNDFSGEVWDNYYFNWYTKALTEIGTSVDYLDIFYDVRDWYSTDQYYGPTTSTVATDWVQQVDYYTDVYVDHYVISGLEAIDPNPSASYEPGHGDWVLESFFQQIDDPSSIEIIAIDVDFTTEEDFASLFSKPTNLDGLSVLESLIWGGLNSVYDPANQYILAGVSASWGANVLNASEIEVVGDLLYDNGAPVFQAVANVGQVSIPWGDVVPNVINVGAYNIDQNGYVIAADESGYAAIDILANGYVISENSWGWNFGTSFATPRVFAETVNLMDEKLTPSVLSGETVLTSIAEMDTLTQTEVASYASFLVGQISTPVNVYLSGLTDPIVTSVLADDIEYSSSPVVVPISAPESGLIYQSSSIILEDTERPYAVSFSPVDGATAVELDSDFVITLNETANFGSGYIRVVSQDGSQTLNIEAGDSQLILSGNTLTVNPSVNLLSGVAYQVSVDAGFLLDQTGNASLELSDYDFTTVKLNEAPVLVPTLRTGHDPWDPSTVYVSADGAVMHITAPESGLLGGLTHDPAEVIGRFGGTLDWIYFNDADSNEFTVNIIGEDQAFVTAEIVDSAVHFYNVQAFDYENPGDADSDNVYDFTIVVSDGELSDEIEVSLIIQDFAEFPQLVMTPEAITWYEGDAVKISGDDFGAYFTDSDLTDGTGLPLQFYFAGLPDFLTDETTSNAGSIWSGISKNSDVGQYQITVTAEDEFGLEASTGFELTIKNVNDSPEVAHIPNAQTYQNILHQVDIASYFTDVDLEVSPAETLTFSALGLPGSYSINGFTGEIYGTSLNLDVGIHHVTVSASDAAGASVASTFELAIKNVNDAPTVQTSEHYETVRADYSLSLASNFDDVDLLIDDSEALTYSLVGDLPEFATFDESTGLLNGALAYGAPSVGGNEGQYKLVVTATDREGLAVSQALFLELVGYEQVTLGTGDDVFFGGVDAELIETGGGADTIYAGAGDDIIVIQGSTGDGVLSVRGEAGDDVFQIEADFSGDVDLSAGSGKDTIEFRSAVQSTSIDEATGDLNVILADGSKVALKGQLVKDAVSGQWVASADAFEAYTVISTAADGSEVIDQMPLSEILFGTKGADVMDNTSDNRATKIFAFDGDDKVLTGEGADFIDAGAGDDYVSSGKGDDVLLGGAGADTLVGGEGSDRLEGGEGDDTYIYATNDDFKNQGLDTIIENSGGDADKVVMTRSLWNYSDGNNFDSQFDNRAGAVGIDADGHLTLAAVNESGDLEGIVIQDFAKRNDDGTYVNTVELYHNDGGPTWYLDPDGVVNPESQDRYYLIANSETTQSTLSDAGVFVDDDNIVRYGVGDSISQGLSFSGHADTDSQYSSRLVMMGGASHDVLLGKWGVDSDEWIIGNDGSDWFLAGSGTQALVGGEGDDQFHIHDVEQTTTIFGDHELYLREIGSEDPWDTLNASYGDQAFIEWSWEESRIELLDVAGRNAYRIEKLAYNAENETWETTGRMVDIYDVEQVHFQNKTDGVGDGTFNTKLLTDGRPIGAGDWISDKLPPGHDVAYSKEAVSFVVAGDTLRVYADLSVTEQVSVTKKVGKKKVTRLEDRVTHHEGELIWEGPRTEVDKFVFAHGVEVNVMNIAENEFLHDPNDFDSSDTAQLEIYIGTEWDDIIFGDDRDNLIDGLGGNDIIFGGGGDDVLIGGQGDDALIGGDGADILRGDGADDVAATAFAQAQDGYFDLTEEALLVSGNDLLIGGDGVDDLATGGGDDVAATDRLDRNTREEDGTITEGVSDGRTDIETIHEVWAERDKLFEDDQWI